MLNEKILKSLNEQINAEIYSSYLYLSMAAYFDAQNLTGFGNWMKVQVQEEMVHAMKLYGYINDKGGAVTLTAIAGPPTDWNSPVEAVETLCKHEAKVTGLINNLVDIALEQHDHATNIFLQWFVTEQVEEEASGADVLHKVKLVSNNSQGLYMLDKELASRAFTMPQTNEGG